MEEFDSEREKLRRHHQDKKDSMSRRHSLEEVELESKFCREISRLMANYTPNCLGLDEATNYRDGAVFMICENSSGPYAYQIYSIGFQLVHGASRSSYGSSPRPIPEPVKQLENYLYPISMAFFSIGSKIYMVGGEMIDQRTGSQQTCKDVYVYDTVTNCVMPGPSMLKPKVVAFVMGPIEGKFYVHGDSLQDHDFELFDPELEQWFELPHAPIPSTREDGYGYEDCRQPPEYDIVAYAVIDHTILLSTIGGHTFSFDISTKSWNEEKGSALPFYGGTVLANGQLYALVEKCSEFPLFAFHVKRDPYELFEEGPVKNLPRPTDMSDERLGYVDYLGNQDFCVVRSGYDGSPYSYDCSRPKHYVTIDLFRVETGSRCEGLGSRIKSHCLSAVDLHSLSYIMDDNHSEYVTRMICFATPILNADDVVSLFEASGGTGSKAEDKEMEEFDAQRQKLIKHYEDKNISMKRRYCEEEVELERLFYGEINRLMEKYTPNCLDLKEATNYRDGAVFMICQNIAGPYAYEIYSIDFKRVHGGASQSSYGSSPRSITYPVKQLERELYPICMGFFSIGSKIYMVGGEMIDQRTGREQTCKDVYVYDTVTNCVRPGPSMLKPKVDPFVMGPIEGKFYVLGDNIHDHDFELFDPELEQWFELPHAPVPSTQEDGYEDCSQPHEYDIVAYAVIDHAILLSTVGGHTFSFDISTKSWKEEKGCALPFDGGAVLADGQLYALVENSSEFPLFAFHVKRDPYELYKEAPVKNLPRPAGRISDERRGYVAYLGNQDFCVVRAGYDGSPKSYDYRPPKHYVTIDLFRVKSESHCRRRGSNVKSHCLFAVDHHSLSYIMDDNRSEDVARMICFATPILSPAVTRG